MTSSYLLSNVSWDHTFQTLSPSGNRMCRQNNSPLTVLLIHTPTKHANTLSAHTPAPARGSVHPSALFPSVHVVHTCVFPFFSQPMDRPASLGPDMDHITHGLDTEHPVLISGTLDIRSMCIYPSPAEV